MDSEMDSFYGSSSLLFESGEEWRESVTLRVTERLSLYITLSYASLLHFHTLQPCHFWEHMIVMINVEREREYPFRSLNSVSLSFSVSLTHSFTLPFSLHSYISHSRSSLISLAVHVETMILLFIIFLLLPYSISLRSSDGQSTITLSRDYCIHPVRLRRQLTSPLVNSTVPIVFSARLYPHGEAQVYSNLSLFPDSTVPSQRDTILRGKSAEIRLVRPFSFLGEHFDTIMVCSSVSFGRWQNA